VNDENITRQGGAETAEFIDFVLCIEKKNSNTRLKKAKRAFLVQLKYTPAKVEKTDIEAVNLIFLPRKIMQT